MSIIQSKAAAIIRPDITKRKFINYTYGLDFKQGYTLDYAEEIKRRNPDAIIKSVGGIRSARMMKGALKNKKVDMISTAKPFIREQNLVKKIKKNPNTISACISCNHCLIFNEADPKGLRCDYP